ncbi:MAG: hypothetical protein OEY94_08605 [Alphaproteobacteria bacterium]|nr:hypothetical protein [Alphaproteobacteria bacterium]
MLKKPHSQKGSVIVYILIAIALFAALGYAVAGMMRSSGESISKETQNINASEILNYAKAVRTSLHNVRISNACNDNQISFERNPFNGSDPLYVNASAPADFSCHVFHPNGGGANYITPSPVIGSNSYFFTGELAVSGQGRDSNAEITMILRGIDLALCEELNNLVGLAPPATDPVNNLNFVTNGFQGSFVISADLGSTIGTGNALYNNQPAGCFFENNATSGEYFFYQVLVAR